MQGAGNDFIVINNMEEKIPHERFPAIAARLCSRRLSIGADGFMVVEAPQEGGDYKMLFYNSDGSVGEMCGNGARCIARYGYEHGLAGEVQTIETTAGTVTGKRVSARQYRIRMQNPEDIRLECPIDAEGKTYDCSYMVVGVPHAVVLIQGLEDFDRRALFELGRTMRFHAAFPSGANVDFIEVTGSNEVRAMTYERGVEDFTYACGTGASAIAVALTLQGKADGNQVKIHMPGGVLAVDVECGADRKVKDIFLTGPTNIVAVGEVHDEDLNV